MVDARRRGCLSSYGPKCSLISAFFFHIDHNLKKYVGLASSPTLNPRSTPDAGPNVAQSAEIDEC